MIIPIKFIQNLMYSSLIIYSISLMFIGYSLNVFLTYKDQPRNIIIIYGSISLTCLIIVCLYINQLNKFINILIENEKNDNNISDLVSKIENNTNFSIKKNKNKENTSDNNSNKTNKNIIFKSNEDSSDDEENIFA